jgi:hypothetical protein
LTDRAALDGLFRRVKFDQVIHLTALAGVCLLRSRAAIASLPGSLGRQ